MNNIRKILVVCVLVGIISASGMASDTGQSLDLLNYYFDLIKSGNLESAVGLWQPNDMKAAGRLGIEYDGIPIKTDYYSPIMYDFKSVENYLNNILNGQRILGKGAVRWKFNHSENGVEQFNHFYFCQKSGNYFWLITPYSYYTPDWKTVSTEYFVIHIHPNAVNEFCGLGASELDRFVTETAEKIDLDKKKLELLREKKIDYFLCPNEFELSKLIGFRTWSMYDRAVDYVSAINLSGYNAVAELLVNLNMEKHPYKTISLLQDGLSYYFGGRVGRASGVTLDFGEYIHRFGLFELDSIISFDAGKDTTGMNNIAAPLMASFAGYLFETLGRDRFFDMYEALSGSYQTIDTLSELSVKSTISEYVGKPWEEIAADFNEYIESYPNDKGNIKPGNIDGGEMIINRKGFSATQNDSQLAISCTLPDVDTSVVNLMFYKIDTPDGFLPRLFKEQFGNKTPFNGYRYCLRIDKNEVGLYDYATDQLIGKFINNRGIDQGYIENGTVHIAMHLDLVDFSGLAAGEYDLIR